MHFTKNKKWEDSLKGTKQFCGNSFPQNLSLKNIFKVKVLMFK